MKGKPAAENSLPLVLELHRVYRPIKELFCVYGLLSRIHLPTINIATYIKFGEFNQFHFNKRYKQTGE